MSRDGYPKRNIMEFNNKTRHSLPFLTFLINKIQWKIVDPAYNMQASNNKHRKHCFKQRVSCPQENPTMDNKS